MKKLYEEPVIEVRNYILPPSDVVMTSKTDLDDGDDYEYFG